MKPAAVLLAAAALLLIPACITGGGSGEPRQKKDQQLFSQAQKAFDARDYADAAELFRLYVEQFPQAPAYTIALQRLGESCEGLLEGDYTHRLARGEQESLVRQEFLSRYGRYDCWQESAAGLTYNLIHYKTILEKFPDSPIADEAAYRSITWETDYHESPEGPLRELEQLEKILEKYPGTSLRYEILYKMARRCHILTELYSFASGAGTRDSAKAEQYRTKALYLYKLALQSPEHTRYSQKAWDGLKALEENRRIHPLD